MVDFSLTHFLDRFAFKNPKKENEHKPESLVQSMHQKNYASYGSRGKSVKQLNASNVTEDEKFIFEYLNRKRERQAMHGLTDQQDEVDDDEFDAYLDSLGGKKKKKKGGDATEDDDDDDELDFFGNMGDGKTEGDDEVWDDEDDNDDDEDDGDNESDAVKQPRGDHPE